MSSNLHSSNNNDHVNEMYGRPESVDGLALGSGIIPIITDSTSEDILLEPCGGYVGHLVDSFWNVSKDVFERMFGIIQLSKNVILFSIFIVYMAFVIKNYVDTGASLNWCNGYGMAFLLFGLILFIIIYKILKQYVDFTFCCEVPFQNQCLIRYCRYGLIVGFLIFFIIYTVINSWDNLYQLMSFSGILVFLFMGLIFSKHPNYIRWDTVFTGLSLQLLIGLLTIPIEFGRKVFKCIGDTIVHFLEFGYQGAEFAYGDAIINEQQVFAFKALSVIYFLSMIVQIMFYLGWIQVACLKVGKLIQTVLGTTVIESVNAIATVFLGQSEAPLVYGPYIKYLTPSEIHAVMTACFATVAGTMLAAYTTLGVDPKNVITASAMAAPGALTYAKLYYPENKKSSTSNNITLLKSDDISIMDAACKGTFTAVGIVGAIIASVIACVSFVGFLNGVTNWLGYLLGYPDLTLEYILGLIFIPLAFVMGVKREECQDVGSLIGLKTLANEFVAYVKLGELKKQGKLSVRSEAIATFALCGFANPGALATLIALLTSLAPNKRTTIITVAIRSFITGSITSFSSACIAGLLTPENGF